MKLVCAPDRVVIKRGGGCVMRAFGVPLALIGLGITAAIATSPPLDTGSIVGLVVSTLVFTMPGLAMTLHRARFVADQRDGRASAIWGVLMTFSRRSVALAKVTAVRITKAERSTGRSGGKRTVYPVHLATASGGSFSVGEEDRYDDARRVGEALAKLVRRPLEDSGSGVLSVRDPDRLDESLAARARRDGKSYAMPDEPPNCRIRPRLDGDTRSLDLLRGRFGPVEIALAIFGGAPVITGLVLIAIAIFFDMGADTPGYGGGAVALITGLPFLLVGLYAATHAESLTVSPRELVVISSWLLGRRRVRIAAAEIEELVLRPGEASSSASRLLVRSDRAVVDIGRHLRRDELAYLEGLIRAVVC